MSFGDFGKFGRFGGLTILNTLSGFEVSGSGESMGGEVRAKYGDVDEYVLSAAFDEEVGAFLGKRL